MALENVTLRGERLSFRLDGKTYSGRVQGATIDGNGAWSAQRSR